MKKVYNYKNLIIKRENGNLAIIRKGNTHLLVMQTLVSSAFSLRGCLAVQLSLALTQKVCNWITTCHVKQSINCEQNANILRETELTCNWVVVPTMNKFVAFVNRAEGAVSAGQEYSFFVTVHFSLPFSIFEKGDVLRAGTVSTCC